MSDQKLEFNEDELNHPEWMNNDFFLNIMKKYKKDDDLKVTNVKITPASMKGDHFASIIFRAVVDYKTGKGATDSISLIVKTQPVEEGFKKDMMGETPIFKTEIAMYSKILPEVHERYRAAGVDVQLGPECVYHSLIPHQVIVFTDITKDGYEMKRDMCSHDEAETIIKKLAQWQAATFCMIRENPGLIETYRQGFFNIDMPMDFMDQQAAELAKTIPQWPGFEKYDKVFKDYARTYKSTMIKIGQPSENNFNVMIHGDFHQRNMMHKLKEGKIYDTLFLDFQGCYVGSPGMDLIYLFYMILDDDARDNHRDEIIERFYEYFITSLKQLAFLGLFPSLLDLHKELLRCGPLEAFIAYQFLGIFKMDPTEIDFNKLLHPTEGDEMRRKVINSPAYKEFLQKNSFNFLRKGFLV